MILKYALLWIPMVFLAVVNGIFRQMVFIPRFSELRSHQLSCLTGVALFTAYTWLIHRRWPLESAAQAWTVGLVWLFLTVAFEFTFGYYVAHRSWESLLQEYRLFSGRLWVLVLLAVALLPVIVFKLQTGRELE